MRKLTIRENRVDILRDTNEEETRYAASMRLAIHYSRYFGRGDVMFWSWAFVDKADYG